MTGSSYFDAPYLKYGNIVQRLRARGYNPDVQNLTILTRKNIQLRELPHDMAIRCNQNGFYVYRLPPGCSVKRGFDVDETDYVSRSDQYISFLHNNITYIYAINELIAYNDRISPED